MTVAVGWLGNGYVGLGGGGLWLGGRVVGAGASNHPQRIESYPLCKGALRVQAHIVVFIAVAQLAIPFRVVE